MRFSLSTVYSTVLFSNVLLILVAVLMRNEHLMHKIGYRIVAAIWGLTIFRLLLPLEFPFTVSCKLPSVLSTLADRIPHTLFRAAGLEISLGALIGLLWITGIFYRLLHFVAEYVQMRRYIAVYGHDISADSRYAAILSQVCREKKRKNRFRIIEVQAIRSPMLYGLLSPRILMPAGLHLSDTDLYYVFCHETTHYFQHDILLKMLIRFLSALYWWNPACSILKQQTDILFEMRVDAAVTHADAHAVSQYLRCLIHIAEFSPAEPSLTCSVPIALISSDSSALEKRFLLLTSKSPKAPGPLRAGVLLLSLFLFLSSYLCSFEVSSAPTGVTQTSTEMSLE